MAVPAEVSLSSSGFKGMLGHQNRILQRHTDNRFRAGEERVQPMSHVAAMLVQHLVKEGRFGGLCLL